MQVPVLVTPKAHKNEVLGWRENAAGERELIVHVTAAPEKGKATKAASVVLAAYFNVPKSSVRCIRGEASRHKMFDIPC